VCVCTNRTVSTQEGQDLANTFGCAFTEASAKHNENVKSAFQLVVIEIEKELNPESARSQSSSGAGKDSWGNWFKGMFGNNSPTKEG
jgi:hypothetical protein